MKLLLNIILNYKCYWVYFKSILRHKWMFLNAIITELPSAMYRELQYYPIIFRLLWRAVTHDLSKFRPSEFMTYAHTYFNGNGVRKPYRDSPAMDYAWNNHLKRNSHHWQYYIRIDDSGKAVTMIIPIIDVLEMVLDWTATGWSYDDAKDWRVWYNENKDKIKLHSKTRLLIDKLYSHPENILTYPNFLKK